MREYRRVPALESGSKLSNPDLQDIGEKNYTDIILRYGNLTTRFPQLNTNAKTIVAAINELYAHPGGTTVIPNPLDNQILTESGESLELEQGGILQTEQGGGGTVVGPLNSISIDGDIYTIDGGGTSVVANPSTEPDSEVLSSLGISGVNYNISGIHTQGETLFNYTSTWSEDHRWNINTLRQTVNVPGVKTTNCAVFVSPAVESYAAYPNSYEDYIKYGIRAVDQSDDFVTFQCDELPDSNISVNICYFYTD